MLSLSRLKNDVFCGIAKIYKQKKHRGHDALCGGAKEIGGISTTTISRTIEKIILEFLVDIW